MSPLAVLVFIGGALYTVGALAYAFKRPNPAPATFGYHEIFHLFVIVAAAVHFVASRSFCPRLNEAEPARG